MRGSFAYLHLFLINHSLQNIDIQKFYSFNYNLNIGGQWLLFFCVYMAYYANIHNTIIFLVVCL